MKYVVMLGLDGAKKIFFLFRSIIFQNSFMNYKYSSEMK